MTPRFEKLMAPGMIGPVKTRNRIIKTANGTSYVDPDQTCGDRMIAYYERLARGGVGFLIVESCGVEYPLGIQHVHYQPTAATRECSCISTTTASSPALPGSPRRCTRPACPVSIQFQHAGAWNPPVATPGHEDQGREVRLGDERGGVARA